MKLSAHARRRGSWRVPLSTFRIGPGLACQSRQGGGVLTRPLSAGWLQSDVGDLLVRGLVALKMAAMD